MDITYKNNETGCLEFVAYYEKLLSECMDPFRRCRSGEFDARELEPYLMEAFLAFGGEKQKEKLNELFSKTNQLFDEYYQKSKKNFGIAPDIFAYRNEVEGEIKRLNKNNLKKIST